jgi:hypothetical protein
MSEGNHTTEQHGYRVGLLLSGPVPLPFEAFLATLRRLLPDASGEVLADGILVLKPTTGSDSVRVTRSSLNDEQIQAVSRALSQTWDWPEAEDALQRSSSIVLVEESETGTADRFQRVHRFHAALRALTEHLPVTALHWTTAQRLVDPRAFVLSLAHGGAITDHAVNIRLFHIPDGKEGELLMDTLGLGAFGLPDLQCHFAGADPAAMGAVLAGYANYLFDKGDVLTDDSLVRGIESFQEWACERGESLAPPLRTVVDFRPDDLWVAP